MAVLSSGAVGPWGNLANTVFESLRECVPEPAEDVVVEQTLGDAQDTHLLELKPLTIRQREFVAPGLTTLRARAAEHDGVQPGLLSHLETMQAFGLEEGVQP